MIGGVCNPYVKYAYRYTSVMFLCRYQRQLTYTMAAIIKKLTHLTELIKLYRKCAQLNNGAARNYLSMMYPPKMLLKELSYVPVNTNHNHSSPDVLQLPCCATTSQWNVVQLSIGMHNFYYNYATTVTGML